MLENVKQSAFKQNEKRGLHCCRNGVVFVELCSAAGGATDECVEKLLSGSVALSSGEGIEL
jgi:hypothetical protein